MDWFDDLDDDKQEQLKQLLENPLNRDAKAYAGGDIEFGCWLVAADRLCRKRTTVSIFDLADMPWRDWYDDEMKPGEAVRLALQEEGF